MYDFGKISGLAGLALAAWLAVLIVRSHLHRRYPFFFVYVASIVPIGVVRFATLSHPWPYFVAYWATEAVYTVLAVLALMRYSVAYSLASARSFSGSGCSFPPS